jgi:hypothetical protein
MLAKAGKELIASEYELRLSDRHDLRQTHGVLIGAFLVSSPTRRTKRRIKGRRKEPWIELETPINSSDFPMSPI